MAQTNRLFCKSENRAVRTLAWVLVFGGVLRIFLSLKTAGYVYDTNTFLAWALRMADIGPAGFYETGYFADYPPGYLLVLWMVGSILRLFGLSASGAGARLVLTIVPILADLALAAFVWHLSRKALGEQGALLLGSLVALNPMLIFDSAVWKQVDAVLTLLLLLCFYALYRKMYPTAGLFYAAALLVKPQALLFGPVFALCYLLPFLFPKDPKTRGRMVRQTIVSAALCFGVLGSVSLLFQGAQTPFVWLVQKYTTTAVSYPYATINAFNLPALFGANWVADDVVFLFLSWKQWGMLGIALSSALLVWFAVCAYRSHSDRYSPWLLAGFYCCGIFTLAHNMHERYLVPGVLFLLVAFGTLRDKRLLRIATVFSFTCLANMATVYCNVDGDQFLQSDAMQLLVRAVSAVQVAAFFYLIYVCYDLCVCGRKAPVQAFYHKPADIDAIGAVPLPSWQRTDTVFITVLTLIVALVSFTYLGTVKVPQTFVQTQDTEQFTVTFDGGFDLSELFVYPAIGTGTISVTDTDGTTLTAELGVYTCWTWTSAMNTAAPLTVHAGEPVTITLSGGIAVNEIALRDASGGLHSPVEVSLPEFDALFDEQAFVPTHANQLNSMYFDEPYHGRTGYELLHGLDVYETTHPPFGKDLIAIGIALFGMCPFGWRFAGTLFGVAMVPVLYLLARRLLKKSRWAKFATVLFAADCMRFTQSRIATIDVFVVFFILLASYFMLWATERMVTVGVRKALVPIALGGAAFGFACASKWTGVYAGLGLCVLYFGALFARRKRLLARQPDRAQELFRLDALRAVAAGVLFWVIVPLLLYAASYLPYLLRADTNFGFADLLRCQRDMFNYHSQLTATHPFQSSWFSWPLIWRPVWYYMGGGLAADQYASIAVLGNPLVWVGGLVGIGRLCVRAVRGRQGAAGSFLLISYASQLLPWVLVSRAVFLYHYFACVPFLALAFAMMLSQLEEERGKDYRKLCYALCLVAVLLFVFFYPAMSGLPVSKLWAGAQKWLPSWGFYIL